MFEWKPRSLVPIALAGAVADALRTVFAKAGLLQAEPLNVWAVALGSGTSGGILAPILIMGAAVGGVPSPILSQAPVGTWSLLGMAAALAGVTRSPLTSVVFALELTHDVNTLLPLLLVATVAHLVSVLTLKRSILTDKVARRGFHVLRDYAVGPLEAVRAREGMLAEERHRERVLRLRILPDAPPLRLRSRARAVRPKESYGVVRAPDRATEGM